MRTPGDGDVLRDPVGSPPPGYGLQHQIHDRGCSCDGSEPAYRGAPALAASKATSAAADANDSAASSRPRATAGSLRDRATARVCGRSRRRPPRRAAARLRASSRASDLMSRRRLAAVASLAVGIATVALAAFVAVAEFPLGLVVLACPLSRASVARLAAARCGAGAWLALAALALAAVLVLILAEGRPLRERHRRRRRAVARLGASGLRDASR